MHANTSQALEKENPPHFSCCSSTTVLDYVAQNFNNINQETLKRTSNLRNLIQ